MPRIDFRRHITASMHAEDRVLRSPASIVFRESEKTALRSDADARIRDGIDDGTDPCTASKARKNETYDMRGTACRHARLMLPKSRTASMSALSRKR
jgi:hypothetical protein